MQHPLDQPTANVCVHMWARGSVNNRLASRQANPNTHIYLCICGPLRGVVELQECARKDRWGCWPCGPRSGMNLQRDDKHTPHQRCANIPITTTCTMRAL